MHKKFYVELFFSFSMCLRVSEEQRHESIEITCLASMFKVSYDTFQNILWGIFGGSLPLENLHAMSGILLSLFKGQPSCWKK